MKADTHSALAIDRYFADCIRARLNNGPLPSWPASIELSQEMVCARLDFHGVALLLPTLATQPAGWPSTAIEHISNEARMQTLWEDSHQKAIGPLIEALHQKGIGSLVLKGTALAYSVHDNPAARRRGDSDILIDPAALSSARQILQSAGFEQHGKPGAFQEVWVHATAAGFAHAVDLHWGISSSATISRAFEADHPRSRSAPLHRLSPNARGTGPLDSLINVCFNRASHQLFGYHVEDAQLFDGDRLIWAVDLHLLASAFSASDWERLCRIAETSGLASIVESGCQFANRALGTKVPLSVYARLANRCDDADRVAVFLRDTPAHKRFVMDFANCSSASEKWLVASQHLLPERAILENRFPAAARWPLWALQVRRLVDAGAKMLLGRTR